jgi:hypothetical protein
MTFTTKDLIAYLPFFIDEYIPKKKPNGGNKGRGEAIVAVTMFLLWIDKHVSEKNLEV